MIEARAQVVRSERHGDQNRVWVRLLEHLGGCGRCDEPGGCHATRLTDVFKNGEQEFAFDDSLGLGPGERVKIVIDDELAPLRAALTSYGLGTAWILLGAAVGNLSTPFAWADLGAGCGALFGGLLALGLLRHRRGVDSLRPRLERDEGNPENGHACARSHRTPT
jgi:sigma-E factor negative regulatory protein RseC